jgi:hypothetical protein
MVHLRGCTTITPTFSVSWNRRGSIVACFPEPLVENGLDARAHRTVSLSARQGPALAAAALPKRESGELRQGDRAGQLG